LATSSVTFKTEKMVKDRAKDIFYNFGLDMSAGLNLLLRALVREGNITFAVEEKPSDEYVAWMKAELQKSLISRQDPNRKVYSEEEMKAKYRVL
jgi:addiction module RelB/DinJ family antitoxin